VGGKVRDKVRDEVRDKVEDKVRDEENKCANVAIPWVNG
jgi:hypothetical protein